MADNMITLGDSALAREQRSCISSRILIDSTSRKTAEEFFQGDSGKKYRSLNMKMKELSRRQEQKNNPFINKKGRQYCIGNFCEFYVWFIF